MPTINKSFKRAAKKILKRISIPFSKNHRYDIETRKIIKRICNENSNCIDVGTHEGEILDMFLKQSQVNVSSLSNGIYNVSIRTAKGTDSKRLVIAH
jgi:phenolic acid decarboxylase